MSELYPVELRAAVGLVVLTAASTEDKAGELIMLHHGTHAPAAHRDWAASGERLCNALAAVAPQHLADRLKKVLDIRHHVIHGIFLWREGHGGMTLKRALGRQAPASFDSIYWTLDMLEGLAAEFEAIELLIDDEISKFMGLPYRNHPPSTPDATD
jgi:hypothetical protein